MSDLFTINNKLQAALEKLFQQHRLVFWYDGKAEMAALFENLSIAEVEKLIVNNDEFTLKYRILIEEPEKRFLIYQTKVKPADNENWMLDLLLSGYEFHTEATSLYLQDLDLPPEFKSLIEQHEQFFSNEKRIQSLRGLLEPEDRESMIRLKMLSVLCNCEPEWEKVLYALFEEEQKAKKEKFKSIEKFGLNVFFWNSIEKKFGYKSINPSIKDFLLQLMQDNLERSIAGAKPSLNKEAYLFVNRWKENTKAKTLFSTLSLQLELELQIENKLLAYNILDLLNADAFSVIDKKLILFLRGHIVSNTSPDHIIQEWIDKRKGKFFIANYNKIYQALSAASSLLDEVRKMSLKIENVEDGFAKYVKHWFNIDRLYRNYIFASEQAEHQNILKDLTLHIEKAYGNSFLLKLGDNWQNALDGLQDWTIENVSSQKQFYRQWVMPYVKKENRVFVIISDALRYESASELRELILLEDKYTADLHAVLGSLPSYTQLGMASLLPHDTMRFAEQSDIVYVDGISTQGTSNRSKILQKHYAGSVAISAEDFLKFHAKLEGREFLKPYNVIYIYSNQIDKIGDDKTSEGKVFEATEDEFAYLLKIIKHISNMNGSNMIITADHGYLYQHNRLDETDFTDFSPTGNIYKNSRRYVLGKDLLENSSVQKWKGSALGFDDDTEALIPKSINRMRIQGAGSRFVHGGASLQEIVIPVLEINKARKSDIEKVEIDVISVSSNITSSVFAVSFFQRLPVADKLLPRQVKVSFYTSHNVLLSDVITLSFASTDNDARAREKRQTFHFTSEASQYNGQDVYLRMEEQIDGTNHFKTYKDTTYRMLIAFSNEFDDF